MVSRQQPFSSIYPRISFYDSSQFYAFILFYELFILSTLGLVKQL